MFWKVRASPNPARAFHGHVGDVPIAQLDAAPAGEKPEYPCTPLFPARAIGPNHR